MTSTTTTPTKRQRSHGERLIPPTVVKLDEQLFRLAKDLNTLGYVNPINLRQERKAFLSKPLKYRPYFRYKQLEINPFKFKETLYRLPVDAVEDDTIRHLYEQVIDQLAKRIDLITSIGTGDFIYNSSLYYGQPTSKDILNANFLVHAYAHDTDEGESTSGEPIIAAFRKAATEYGIDCKIVASDKLVAGALVRGKTLYINSNRSFGPRELSGLVEHELGVHLVTSFNAGLQPLKVLRVGLPGNTHTQEGLAILSEHLSGNLAVHRLQLLALRVLAVDMMIQGVSFNDTYFNLLERGRLTPDEAFTLTARVFRGGGFTKDYLYLSGLSQAARSYQSEDLDPLLVGKTSFAMKPALASLIERGILKPPTFRPRALVKAHDRDPIIDFLISSIH